MADYRAVKIGEMEATFGGGLKKARAELGVASFGMAVEDFPPNSDQYPEHDHSHDGQEEVYVVMRGSADMQLEGDTVHLDPETIVRVGAGTKRRLVTGEEGARVLVLGGTPGKAYQAPEFTELGAPDPLAG